MKTPTQTSKITKVVTPADTLRSYAQLSADQQLANSDDLNNAFDAFMDTSPSQEDFVTATRGLITTPAMAPLR